MHPRLTILTRVFERPLPLAAKLDVLHAAGAERTGLNPREVREAGVDATRDVLARTSIAVTHIGHGPMVPLSEPERWPAAASAVESSLELAQTLGAGRVYGPAGGAPELDWEDAADRFVAAIEAPARSARAQGTALLIEPTISLFADISMLHTLRDTVALAERADIGVCLDVQHCWTERGLHDAIVRCAPRLGLVQLSDWVVGTRHHYRAVPGDGSIPLERIVGWILEAGYEGLFDLEVYPEPGVPERDTIARAIESGGRLLETLGAA